MKSTTTYQMILDFQNVWAISKHIGFKESGQREGYVKSLADNLYYKTFSVKTTEEYLSGQGDEFRSHMKALHSSSALCINFFEYWRQTRRISEIGEACGVLFDIYEMEFEKKHRIPNLGTSHIDVEFNNGDNQAFAIEAKFTEPYLRTTQRNETNLDKYLKRDTIWNGLAECQKLAKAILDEESKKTSWRYLDVPQLIKHILGLSYRYGPKGFTLSYLWYDCGTQESRDHSHEIDEFGERVVNELEFKCMTYQDLFANISIIPRVDNKYLAYLGERYIYTDNANKIFLFDDGSCY